jgi:hypothetical protein
LAQGDVNAAIEDVTKQLRAMGYEPNPKVCIQATDSTPESCSVTVAFGGTEALSFLAFPHLLPKPPVRFQGVETVLTVN